MAGVILPRGNLQYKIKAPKSQTPIKRTITFMGNLVLPEIYNELILIDIGRVIVL